MELDRSTVLPVYLAEAEEGLVEFEESLLLLEAEPRDTELIAGLFRCAHTLKGNSEALGLDAVAACAHAMEGALDAVRRGVVFASVAFVSLLLEAHDAVRGMLTVVKSGETPLRAPISALLARLEEAAAPKAGSTAGEGVDTRLRGAARREAHALQRSTLRVDLAALDRILTATGELSVAQTRLRGVLEGAPPAADASDALGDAERIFAELRDQVMALRLVPIGPMLRQQLRGVRDLAAVHGKLVRLELAGQDVEVDAAVLSQLRDPLMHMVRNAVDHGLEEPAARREKGKDPVGSIRLSARREAGRLLVEIADDGAGFDRARILDKAREIGVVEAQGALRDADIDRLAFAPGLSTSREVTELSGRGVGMDVVARSVAALKGSIAIQSAPGAGTTVSIRVPLTLAIVQAFAVSAATETYLLPLDAVRECIDLPPSARRDARRVVDLRGEALPYLRLRDALSLPGAPPKIESIVIVEQDGQRVGIAVDRLRGESQAVVKPLGRLFDGVDAVVGSTILGDGSVALILDVASLIRGALASGEAAS